MTTFSRENVRENNKKFIENNMRRKQGKNKKYSCGDYGPKKCIGPWTLSENTNKSEERNTT